MKHRERALPSRLAGLSERAKDSLFVVPTAIMFGGILLAVVTIVADGLFGEDYSLPLGVATTAESARSVLSTVASATMTFAGIAFSITLLVFQMSSSQYSPRVIHGLLRDSFNKRIIGLVVGTFTYCLVVLRSVHGPLEGGGSAAIPTLSVTVAVILGVASVLATIGFIDHNAHRMDVSNILHGVTEQTRERASDCWWPDQQERTKAADVIMPLGASTPIATVQDGWVQQLDPRRLLGALPRGSALVMETAPGLYLPRGAVIGRVFPAVDEGTEERDELQNEVQDAVLIGRARTLTQDPTYGLRQMADVALKALSPGINDPTTAQDAIFHITDALTEILLADQPPAVIVGEEGRRVLLHPRSRTDLVELAFAEVRRAAAPHPTVTDYVLAAIEMVARRAGDIDDPDQVAETRRALHRQAELAVAEADAAGVPEWDLAPLRDRLSRLDLGDAPDGARPHRPVVGQ